MRTRRMDRREVESHRLQEPEVNLGSGIVAKLDFFRIAGDTPEDEFVANAHKWIRRPVPAVRQGEEIRFLRLLVAVGPTPGRGPQRLGLAQDMPAARIAVRDEWRRAEAAAALAAVAQANALPVDAFRQAFDQRLRDPALRTGFLVMVDFLPEFLRLALAGFGIGPEPGFAFEQQRRLRIIEALAITPEHGVGRRLIADLAMAVRRQLDAGDEADQIEHVGHFSGFVEIVDAPDQAAVLIAPGPEILQVQIADRQHLWRVHQVRTPSADLLRPAEIGRAKENERAFRHPLVLVADVLFYHVAMPGEPGFVGVIVLAKRHPIIPPPPLRTPRASYPTISPPKTPTPFSRPPSRP